MKVCLFGSYVKNTHGIPSGNGGELIKKILETQKIHVIEVQQDIDNWKSFLPAYVRLFLKHRNLNYDLMIIPWRGILTLPLAKIICRKPIVYFPAFSIYDTMINDRKKIKKNSILAKFIHTVDKWSCKFVNRIILESSAEIDYFISEFNLPKKKFYQLPLSCDESIFKPLSIKKPNSLFNVFFFGTFIPLHGVETIAKAALLLQKHSDIVFYLSGDGQMKSDIENFIKKSDLKNVKLLGLISIEKLLQKLNDSDVCLGIFGNSIKSYKVVTNKGFQILASQKPLITMDSPAAIECGLENKKNCILVSPSDPQELKDAILLLKNNPEISSKIAKLGYQNYTENLSLAKTGIKLKKILLELFEGKPK